MHLFIVYQKTQKFNYKPINKFVCNIFPKHVNMSLLPNFSEETIIFDSLDIFNNHINEV